ncbi:MAG: HNH endonuclease [Oscillospiraceae bacterium]|nr:HNH endonuclease [Oscillospiraceae bacterium]
MTKIEAIKTLMTTYNGIINWQIIYNEIEKYYPDAKKSSNWQAGLRGVLYREMKKGTIKRVDDGVYALVDYDITNMLPEEYKNDLITEKNVIVKVRTLQQQFRKELLKNLKMCPITLVSDKRLLYASHIKPWCLSDSFEKLDTNNGFILSPLYDVLFDKGLITFSNKKELVLSAKLKKETAEKLQIKEKVYENLPICGRENYLDFHREKIFLTG